MKEKKVRLGSRGTQDGSAESDQAGSRSRACQAALSVAVSGKEIMKKQRTIDIQGHKIKVLVYRKTSMGNLMGFRASVTDNKGHQLTIPFIGVVSFNEAFNAAYVKFVKKFC